MRRAMLLKEFRELAVWAGVLLAIMILATIGLTGINPFTLQRTQEMIPIPFINQDGVDGVRLYGSMAAIILALRQTVGESVQGTWLLLLHRPVTKRWLIIMKILVGLSLFLSITAIPLAGYAMWAAIPGTHASPFRWSFTIPAWVTWVELSIVYLGAFMCGLRDARWLGSRMLPLVSIIFLFMWVSSLNTTHFWLTPILITLAFDGAVLLTIFYVTASREFTT